MKKIILLLVGISLFACKTEQKLPENFDYGSIDNGVYKNDYFKMQFPFDTSWEIQTQEQMDAIANSGADLLTNETTKRAVKATEINSANLFSAFKYKEGFEEDYNYSIALVAENTKSFPNLKRGSDYLKEAKKIMTQTVINYEFEDDFSTKTMGSKTFDVMTVSGNYMGISFNQQYLTTIMDGFSLSFIISYNADAQRQELERILDGITFYDENSKKKVN